MRLVRPNWLAASSVRTTGFLLLIPLLAGCSREAIQSYSVPKEKRTTAPASITWKLPAGWTEQPATGMRVGSFAVTGKEDQKAEISVIPLSGEAGSDLDNINRWRAQVGAQPVTADQLGSLTEKVQIGAAQGTFHEASGSSPETGKPARLFGAILSQGGTSWFFKMIGSEALVAEQKMNFEQFLKSVAFAAATPSQPLAGVTPATPASASPPEASPLLPTWEVPAGWRQQTASTMLLARFALGDPASGKGDLTVSVFPGDVGGLVANVNRWRNQLGLGPIDASEVPKLTSPLDMNGAKATLVELSNEQPGSSQAASRMLVAILQREGQTWFFKLLGDDRLVVREKPAFLKFVQSVRFPHA